MVRAGFAAVATALALVTAGLSAASPTADAAETAVRPLNGYLVVTGAGWGHGKGMSQYGAYGAADAGLSHEKILSFYYPGTTLKKLAGGTTLRVWITADNDKTLNVVPSAGQRVRDAAGHTYTLPTGSKYRQWRIKRSGSKRVLQYLNSKSAWVTRTTTLTTTRVWSIDNPSRGLVTVRLPGGRNRDYRGKLALRFFGSGARTVNTVTMESYLRGVVPREMPTSWHAEAVQAQAVAARSYAARFQRSPQGSVYDLCDTAACQVYGGQDDETSGGNAAVAATANRVVTYRGAVALTMFSSSNGGHSADGGLPYLVAKADPYDGRMHNQAWSIFLSAARIKSAYPSIGTLSSVRVSARDGHGWWGGRADSVVIAGSKSSLTVTGGAFKRTFGLKERLFGVFAGLKPGTANSDRWQNVEGGTTGSLGAPIANEVAVAGGLAARFSKGDLYWSKATGSRRLNGRLATAYRSAGGPASALGFPVADGAASGSSVVGVFQHGVIRCPASGDCLVQPG
ncbi:MAG TPA: SpoIID/LytB domain-containing protein [Micropruina sp.]|jgi:SpoIID/LytB domain protein|nr:SpoIID/LytB domain-containing protein [Micropruina sp.]